jgi:hypothetical protein
MTNLCDVCEKQVWIVIKKVFYIRHRLCLGCFIDVLMLLNNKKRGIGEMVTIKVRLPRAVHGDWPIGQNLRAEAGIYEAIANQYGAVSVILKNGELLGVKPDEFERVIPLEGTVS